MRHFYHVYADGRWPPIITEHLAALTAAGMHETPAVIGIAGKPVNRVMVREWLRKRRHEWHVASVHEADGGWEHVTLTPLRRYVWRRANDEPVLYMHTKGASYSPPDTLNERWRRSMTTQLVDRWQFCTSLLTGNYDLVGCHWLGPADWRGVVTVPFFGGNFWWARTGYLRTLPVPDVRFRSTAEGWLGQGRNPRVFDLTPGWPAFTVFARYADARNWRN